MPHNQYLICAVKLSVTYRLHCMQPSIGMQETELLLPFIIPLRHQMNINFKGIRCIHLLQCVLALAMFCETQPEHVLLR